MIDLLNEIQTRLKAILAAELFDDPAGSPSVPMVKIGGLDPKRSGDLNDEDFPFVVVRPIGGQANPRDDRVTVQLIGGIWTGAEVLGGFTAIDRLGGLLLSLANTRGFDAFNLALPAPWHLGDDDGQHPHPYYFVTINLSFIRTNSGC